MLSAGLTITGASPTHAIHSVSSTRCGFSFAPHPYPVAPMRDPTVLIFKNMRKQIGANEPPYPVAPRCNPTALIFKHMRKKSVRTSPHTRSHQGATLQSSHNQSPNRATARLTAELRSAIMRLGATLQSSHNQHNNRALAPPNRAIGVIALRKQRIRAARHHCEQPFSIKYL